MIVYRLKAATAAVFVCLAALFSLCLGGCVSGGGRDAGSLNTGLPPAGQQSPAQQGDPADGLAEAKLLQDIDGISELAAPEGISIKLWNEMAAELERVVKRRQIVGSRRASTGTGTPAPYSNAGTPAPYKSASAATDEASRTTLVYDEEADTLSFAWYMTGDYDQNGLVGISDLTPLGAHFGKTSGSPGEPFPAESIESVVDGDANGLIGIADITPIGAFFGERQLGYRVYRSMSMDDWPADGLGPNGPGAELVEELTLEEASSGGNARRVFSLSGIEPPAEGQLFYWARGYDDSSVEGIASLPLLIESEGVDPPENLAPIAVLTADNTSGFAPLTVQFNAFSSIDLDGNLTGFEWDWDGPVNGEQWEDTGTDGIVEHEYTEVGDYLPTVRVTDNLGATDTASIPVRVREQIPPIAVLNASHGFGPTPLKVTYDASMSSDSDGLVELYEWDFDGDGEFEYSSGDSPFADFWYYDPGSHEITVRVTDNDGLSATDSWPVVVQLGKSWKTTVVDENINQAVANYLGAVALCDVSGHPALAYGKRIQLDEVNTEVKVVYTRAANPSGSSWGLAVDVMTSDSALFPASNSARFYLQVLNDNPTFAGEDVFCRSTDPLGAEWSLPVELFTSSAASGPAGLFEINSFPAVSSGIAYVIADDPTGSAWSQEVEHKGNADSSAAAVAGRAAVAYSRLESLFYIRALDNEGSAWSVPLLLDTNTETGFAASLAQIAGCPAIAYYDRTLELFKYIHALDPQGTEWKEPIYLDVQCGNPQYLLALPDGRPAIAYRQHSTDGLRFIAANEPGGTYWTYASTIAVDENVGSSGRNIDFAVVAGEPAVAYSSLEASEEGEVRTLKYVAFAD